MLVLLVFWLPGGRRSCLAEHKGGGFHSIHPCCINYSTHMTSLKHHHASTLGSVLISFCSEYTITPLINPFISMGCLVDLAVLSATAFTAQNQGLACCGGSAFGYRVR
ncbi:hypothetical protein E2C01_057650 [Portunus trituberculatus]|uniref:Uncharacterized protein n=1 Tax=Portunus trituberculatus TaxID=210409 RepID=A0A5B7GTJ0_PORTR|nr:hypothetical protein [Portunus trituberculatus]